MTSTATETATAVLTPVISGISEVISSLTNPETFPENLPFYVWTGLLIAVFVRVYDAWVSEGTLTKKDIKPAVIFVLINGLALLGKFLDAVPGDFFAITVSIFTTSWAYDLGLKKGISKE